MKDKKVAQIIELENRRINSDIPLIASENIVSQDVLEALSSNLINKYAEGSVGKRYYAGNSNFDLIETLAQKRALELFVPKKYRKFWLANVQPLSGSPANLAIYAALLQPGDTILAMRLDAGGHLSHGHHLSLAGKLYKVEYYQVDEKTEQLDYEQIAKLAQKVKPKMIIAGASAYSRAISFAKFSKIAKSVDALLLADISHVAGLVATGQHPQVAPFADIVMTTTHKTLRGPRGAVILAKKKLMPEINKGVFPGVQGGPHGNQIAAKAVAFYEASKPEFKKYIQQVIINAQVMAKEFSQANFTVISGGTENHLFMVNVMSEKLNGKQVQDDLENIGVILNANQIPFDLNSPLRPSGIRIGTAAVTTLGADKQWSKQMAKVIISFLREETSVREAKHAVAKLRSLLDKVE